MALDMSVTILCSRDDVRIEVKDDNSRSTFLTLTLTPDMFTAALGRLACVPAKANVKHLERVGKEMVIDHIQCPLPASSENVFGQERKLIARETITEALEGTDWTPDLDLGSRDSFFEKDGATWVRTPIRKWVEIEEAEKETKDVV